VALRSEYNILSLCSGVGGLDLGVKLALSYAGRSGRGVAYVEGEVAAASSLVASMEAGWLHPAPIWSDMRTFDAKPWRGNVHILASGDPCQENSVAGKGAGADGERFLAPEVCRIAAECRPDIVFRENVPGNSDGQIEAIVPALEGLGCRVAAGIFSSSETGNTMRRERLFIMAECDSAGFSLWGNRSRNGAAPHGGGETSRLGDSRDNELARTPSERRGKTGRDSERSEEWTGGTGAAMGSPIGGSDGWNAFDTRRGSIQRTSVDGAGGDGGKAMGRTNSEQPQRVKCGELNSPRRENSGRQPALSRRAIFQPPTIIPGPTDSRWIDVLDRFPEYQPALSQEEAQSHLRRGIDAMAHRVERLRATGNGVDPMGAAYAFLSLNALLRETRGR